MQDHRSYTRREFLDCTTSCAAHMGVMAAASPLWLRGLWTRQERFPVVASEPWGRLEEISEGIWGLVSNPLQGCAVNIGLREVSDGLGQVPTVAESEVSPLVVCSRPES